jgi:hypothetical protein
MKNDNSVKVGFARKLRQFYDRDDSVNEKQQERSLIEYIAEMEIDWQNTFSISSNSLKIELFRAIIFQDGHLDEKDFLKIIDKINCSERLKPRQNLTRLFILYRTEKILN